MGDNHGYCNEVSLQHTDIDYAARADAIVPEFTPLVRARSTCCPKLCACAVPRRAAAQGAVTTNVLASVSLLAPMSVSKTYGAAFAARQVGHASRERALDVLSPFKSSRGRSSRGVERGRG